MCICVLDVHRSAGDEMKCLVEFVIVYPAVITGRVNAVKDGLQEVTGAFRE